MRLPRVLIPTSIVLGALLALPSVGFGKAEYTKKEKKGCVVCHVTAKSKELNDVGKCYGKNKSLAGCEAGKAGEK